MNENAFMDEHAIPLGYCAFAARGSRGTIDVICFQDGRAMEADGLTERDIAEGIYRYGYDFCDGLLRPLVVQVGTHRKPIAATLRELQAAPRPIGSLCVVARRLKQKGRERKWQFVTERGKYATLKEAIEA